MPPSPKHPPPRRSTVAEIRATAYHLPEEVLCNRRLEAEFPRWTADRIREKTGISERRVAAEHECASDLGVAAAQSLFQTGACRPDEVDYLLFCTQSPDYFLPPSACIIQDRLGLPTSCGGLDINLGCSGFIYGLGLAKGLIETGQASKVLLITAETYSKHIHPEDGSVRPIFGDAAAATLIRGVPPGQEGGDEPIGPFVFGTDGRGAEHLIVPAGGMRCRMASSETLQDPQGNRRTAGNLFMDGAEIFNFTLKVVPRTVQELLSKAEMTADDVDLFVFHQANEYMLEHLRRKMGLPKEKFLVALRDFGNTVSATIPIALRCAEQAGQLHAGDRIMLVGFGVGYSWGATLIRWPHLDCPERPAAMQKQP